MSSSIWGGTDFVHANALREAFTRKTTTRSCGSWWWSWQGSKRSAG